MNRRGESGQILVIAALVQVVLLVFVGFAVDYGALLLERTRLQNAADAASLAGARALVDGPSPGVTPARAAVTTYLDLHGYRSDATTTIAISFPPSPGTGAIESVQIAVSRIRPTYFIRLVGIDRSTVAANATAAVDRRLIDIMLSLDVTGSMELSGPSDMNQLRRAVVDFVNKINPSTTDTTGPKIGMARFAGVKCGWMSSGAGDTFLDIGPGPSEYRSPCTDDKTVLTNLTYDKSRLIRIADNTGAGTCPGGIGQFACPLVSWRYTAPDLSGAGRTPSSGVRLNGSVLLAGNAPGFTGTKLPNGISVVSDAGYYAWSTGNGGRNNASGEGTARKVLVLMTDGFNELWPSSGHPLGSGAPGAWDTEVVSRANTLKLGPDGVGGTPDDVEVYTIGFFCTPFGSQNWCASRLADTAAPHPCPGGAMPGTASAIDSLLRNVSSSSPGTCDHYFPIKKSEDLPQLFRTLAGTIARGRLTQ
jgi:Flp pilus assembly protein TadG